ncbi:metallopeptidase [Pseudomonas phage Ka3]|uniref:Putative metallopeptidase n=1 Tax=Pseudomonas phage vB_Pae_AM.P2 TaxID=2731695 RepID=A0A7S5W9Z2_9CAUD|nr:putative metallopeptidase [Pseudomonas phage vB_Pae_AM.P2]WQZ52447.1 metallopeptidase [Pseudomonas phage Ka3]
MSSFNEMVSKAKIRLMERPNSVFLANVAMRLRYHQDDEMPTAYVQGTKMGINLEFFSGLTKAQQETLLAHEIGHIVRLHAQRMEHRKAIVKTPGGGVCTLWNIAGDFVINQELKESNFAPLIWKDKNGRECKWCQDDKYKGMTTEEVYQALLEEAKQNGKGGEGEGSGASLFDPNGDPMDDLRPGKGEEGQDEGELTDIIVAAATAARQAGQAGSIPGDVAVFLDNLLQPKLPLAAKLQRFFTRFNKRGFTWERPNRRTASRYYLPSLKGKAVGDILFCFDLSGSVTDEEVKRYISEFNGVLKKLKPESMHMLTFDTEIMNVTKIRSTKDLLKAKLEGRGGTDINPVLAYVEKHKPTAVVVFTDGGFWRAPDRNPGVPILWMIHGNPSFKIDFGQVTHFEV